MVTHPTCHTPHTSHYLHTPDAPYSLHTFHTFYSFHTPSHLQQHVRKVDETRVRLTDKERQERQDQLQRTMQLLVHACSCKDPACPSNSCRKVCLCVCVCVCVFGGGQ